MIDRRQHNIAVAAVWYERYVECSRTQGYKGFPNSVWRFFHSLTNLGEDKLAIKNIVKDYIDNVYQPELINKVVKACIDENITLNQAFDESNRRKIYELIENVHIVELFSFIVQTIQDSGVGWPTEKQMETYRIQQD